MAVEIIRRGVHNWGPLKGQPFVIVGGYGLLFGDDGSGSPVSTQDTDYGKLITAHETVHGLKTRPIFWGHDYAKALHEVGYINSETLKPKGIWIEGPLFLTGRHEAVGWGIVEQIERGQLGWSAGTGGWGGIEEAVIKGLPVYTHWPIREWSMGYVTRDWRQLPYKLSSPGRPPGSGLKAQGRAGGIVAPAIKVYPAGFCPWDEE